MCVEFCVRPFCGVALVFFFQFRHHFAEEERGQITLLCSYCRVRVFVLCHFFAVPWVGLRSVIVAFLGYTHLFF